jgi:hypothetical protein
MYEDRQFVRLAREIAMGMLEIEEILENFRISREEFEVIQKDPAFNKLLISELADWQGAGNTEQRVKVKSAALIEDYLPELYARLNDRHEPLLAKGHILKIIAQLASLGQPAGAQQLQPGDKVVVQINLGADANLRYEKRLPSKVIDHEPVGANASNDIV